MEEVIRFLKENPIGFLASVDNGKPRVRPFGFMLEENGKLYFCTGTVKDVYKQLKNVPSVEFSCLSKDFSKWLRVNGQIKFSDDAKIKEKIINSQPLVKSIYKTADNPVFTIFFIDNGNASLWDFSGNPPKTIKL
ncbi:MAG: pyridoxamine 5'-phosphate oxidase family protein [Spirochaetota bacterium]